MTKMTFSSPERAKTSADRLQSWGKAARVDGCAPLLGELVHLLDLALVEREPALEPSERLIEIDGVAGHDALCFDLGCPRPLEAQRTNGFGTKRVPHAPRIAEAIGLLCRHGSR